MKKIIYYVATSLDGYIAGPKGDISKFAVEGEGVQKYLNDLKEFETVIMGKATYEFGYQYGLPPGQPAYPHMQHYIFSKSLHFKNAHEQVHILEPNVDAVKKLRLTSTTDIYLCGGGIFAGWLLENKLIDVLKLKINPIILGGGTPLFGNSTTQITTEITSSETYSGGLLINTYQIRY